MIASLSVLASALVVLALGVAHLVFTFRGPKLRPRDPELEARMKAVSPMMSSETTMWKAWLGFNASHSFGAIGFGAIYAYLAVAESALLFGSAFLGAAGALLLLGYAIVGWRYWFGVPFRSIVAAAILYGAGFALALAS